MSGIDGLPVAGFSSLFLVGCWESPVPSVRLHPADSAAIDRKRTSLAGDHQEGDSR